MKVLAVLFIALNLAPIAAHAETACYMFNTHGEICNQVPQCEFLPGECVGRARSHDHICAQANNNMAVCDMWAFCRRSSSRCVER